MGCPVGVVVVVVVVVVKDSTAEIPKYLPTCTTANPQPRFRSRTASPHQVHRFPRNPTHPAHIQPTSLPACLLHKPHPLRPLSIQTPKCPSWCSQWLATRGRLDSRLWSIFLGFGYVFVCVCVYLGSIRLRPRLC
ncbi:hypothetical protein BKA80DRAFT_124363 [Phyllosticta citrichinensis]